MQNTIYQGLVQKKRYRKVKHRRKNKRSDAEKLTDEQLKDVSGGLWPTPGNAEIPADGQIDKTEVDNDTIAPIREKQETAESLPTYMNLWK